MAEAVIGVVAEEAVGGCINLIKHHFNYLAQYHDNMQNLNTKLLNLETKRVEVQVKASSATDKGETIIDNVQKWLGEVAGKREEAEEILNDKERVGNGCWRGWFVNFNLRYSLSRKAMKKSADLDTYLERGVFEIVAHPIRPLAHVYDAAGASSSEKMKNNMNHHVLEVQGNEESISVMPAAGAGGGLTSRSTFLNDVMVAVKDPKIRIIRICGMGGIGKTTIAKQVEQRARAENLFNEIAMVEVNQNPDLKILQLHIAELFGLELKEDSVPARAKRISDRLNAKDQNGQNKRILLILDNVWKKKGLEEAGIPLTEEKSLCKILLTSRSDLVCKDIAPEPEFSIGVLPHLESLILFLQCIPKEPFYDQKLAEDLVKECGGLPISVTAIAGAVAGKEEVYWTIALRKLQKSEFKGECAEVFNSLKVSYDFLENEEIKSFFRLFCFFRKGSDVPIEDLARYGMALGCFPDLDNKLYDARSEAHSYANTLLHSSLLLRGGKARSFKVHDIVWDFAIKVPSKDLFMINHGDALITSPTTDSYKNYTSVSLQCSEMVEVPKVVDFRNLKFLQLIGNLGTLPLKFPNNFYEEMDELNVLAFRSLNITSLPKSLQLLRNLLSLSFDRCFVGSDISIIGDLVKLEVLSFAHTDIEVLPIQIANLKALRLLDMTGCYSLREIARDVLSELSTLEELYMRDTALLIGRGKRTIICEIASMSKLVVIDINVPVEVLPVNSLFAKLKCFKVSITTRGRSRKLIRTGANLKLYERGEEEDERGEVNAYLWENYLDLQCDSSVLQQRGVKLLIQEAVKMDLKVSNLEILFPLSDSEENFLKLKKLLIKSCNEMVYLVNMMDHLGQIIVFQNLVSLQLYDLPCLVDMFHVRNSSESFVAPFYNLKVLFVENCNKLEHLFSSSDARSLNMLKVIKIISCHKLKVVFGKGRRGEDKVELRNLKYMTLKKFPDLVGCCSDVDAPEFPQLEELKICGLPLITSIIREEGVTFDSSHSNVSSSHPLFNYKGLHTCCKFQNLKALMVKRCDSLRHILTTSIAISFRELQNLEVRQCKSLTTIIAKEGIKEEKEKECPTEVTLFPKLNTLSLRCLDSLSTFLPKGYILTWPSLKILTLDECGGEWNTLFPNKNNIQGGTITSVTTASNKLALTSLEALRLENMNTPSEFWYDYFPGGFTYELCEILVESSEQSIMFSAHMIRAFQHLTFIWVNSCKSMEVVFNFEEKCIVGEVGSKLPTLNKLVSLVIERLPKLVNVWKKVPRNFQGFGNLTTLELSDCDSLRYLFAPSIAKCLVKLKMMEIKNCKLIEEIVSMGDEQGQLGENIILFPQLEVFILGNLPSLKYLEAPNVVESSGPHVDVNATSTSTFNIMSHQESIGLNLPALVRLQGIVCPWPWSFHKLKTIEVKGCKNLSSIFPTNRVVRLPALETLSVEACKNLQYIFSSSVATSLEQLTHLSIKECEMTEVIRKDEEVVDGLINVVFHSLTSLKLKKLPDLEGICLGMVSFDWPLLTSLHIKYCLKMRIFTTGSSSTPLLNCISINKDVYDPTVGEEDVNTIIRNAQVKVDKSLDLKEEGNYTITDFHLAGDHLIAHYSSWSWESGYKKRGDDFAIEEQYLIARNIPCLRKPRNTTLQVEKEDEDENEVDEDDDEYLFARNLLCLRKRRYTTSEVEKLDEDENEVDRGDDDGEDELNIYKPRTYDVSITYDKIYRTSRLWLKGYDESKMYLPFKLVFEDIHMKYPQEYLNIEDHPYESGPYASVFPRKEFSTIASGVFNHLLRRGLSPSVQNHLQLFVDFIFPTIQFGPAP